MSTFLDRDFFKSAAAVAVFSAWTAGCVYFWNQSTLSGGAYSYNASQIAGHTADAFELTPLCRKAAENLALASVRVRTSDFRTIREELVADESHALQLWELSNCPPQALIGIAYGVSVVGIEYEQRIMENLL